MIAEKRVSCCNLSACYRSISSELAHIEDPSKNEWHRHNLYNTLAEERGGIPEDADIFALQDTLPDLDHACCIGTLLRTRFVVVVSTLFRNVVLAVLNWQVV